MAHEIYLDDTGHETDMVSSDASSEDKELVFDSKKGYFVLVEKNR